MYVHVFQKIFIHTKNIHTIFMSGSKKTALFEDALEEEGKTNHGLLTRTILLFALR